MDDFKLSDHFGFNELTVTNNAALQSQNREEAAKEPVISCLRATAALLERLRARLGAIIANSAFRCPALNGATAGSSKTSQHMLGQAADIRQGEATPETMQALFKAVLAVLIEDRITFGQLIYEEAKRDYGVSCWVHVSLGTPFRDPAKCGQVLMMKDGVYTLIQTVPQPA